MVRWMKKENNFQIAKVQPRRVAWLLLDFFSNFGLTLFIKVLLIKKYVFRLPLQTAMSCFGLV